MDGDRKRRPPHRPSAGIIPGGGYFTDDYISSAKNEFSADELGDIIGVSVKNNMKSGVTGILFYDCGNIIQFIEGEDEAVSAIFAKIRDDPRHTGVMQVMNEPISARLFPDWSMALRHVADLSIDLRAECRNLMKEGVPIGGDDSPHRQDVEDLLSAFKESIR